jgi:GDP-L-fucose synthase
MIDRSEAPCLKNQPVLVTGGAGLVGSNLIPKLIREGANVRATLHHTMPGVSNGKVEYLTCDLTRVEDCEKAVDGIRYVFHCAAKSAGAATTAATPMAQVNPNLVMNTQMLAAAYAARVGKFLWLGSTTAYPLTGNRPVKEEQIFSAEPYEKYFFVGWEKRMMEILCKMYGERLPKPMTTIVLRATNIYGPNDDFKPETSRVTAALIKKVVERQDPIEVWGTGEDIRDHIYVDDVVEAMVRAIEKVDSYTAINIGSGNGYTVKDILQTILEIEEYKNARIIFDTSKPAMIPIRLVDTTKAQTNLGFQAKTDLPEGLRKTIEWYKKSRIVSKSNSGAAAFTNS